MGRVIANAYDAWGKRDSKEVEFAAKAHRAEIRGARHSVISEFGHDKPPDPMILHFHLHHVRPLGYLTMTRSNEGFRS